MKANRYSSLVVLASFLLIFSASGYAGGYNKHHASGVNISVGFNHFDSYGHKFNKHNYGHRYQPKKYFKPRHFNRKYHRGFNQRFNRGYRSSYSRNYCPSRY